jgi:hypothetical protein
LADGFPWLYGFPCSAVNRQRVLEDTFARFRRIKPQTLLYRDLNVTFDEEEGVDAGGLTREW